MPDLVPNSAVTYSQDHQTYPYRVYDLRIRYVWDNGTLDMPVAYTTGSSITVPDATKLPQVSRQACEQIQVAAPQGRKYVTFTLERVAVPPVAPSPDPVNANETLLHADVTLTAPQMQADGFTSLFRMEGLYIYSLEKPQWYLDGFRMGATDVDTSVADQNVTTPSQFQNGYQ